jgi:dCTP deaminase
MILTDREIRISIERGLIDVEPVPDKTAYSSTALDLTLDANISLFRDASDGVEIIDPGAPGYSFNVVKDKISESRTISADGFALNSGKLILAWTRERVSLKPEARVGARVEGKSSLARLGLAVHVTAPTIHSGFEGQIQLEIINHGPAPIRLRSGMRICQLIFEQTSGVPDAAYQGQFIKQGSAAKSKKDSA